MRRRAHEESIEIAASAETIFDLIHDYSRRLQWDPFLAEAVLLDSSHADVGVVARCVAHNGYAMDTVYVSFERPAVAAVKMVRGPWMFSAFAATLRQEAAGDGTRVTYRYNFETRPGFLWWLVNPMFARETRRRLQRLKEYVERSGSHTGRTSTT